LGTVENLLCGTEQGSCIIIGADGHVGDVMDLCFTVPRQQQWWDYDGLRGKVQRIPSVLVGLVWMCF
jgi:hypothetical protein